MLACVADGSMVRTDFQQVEANKYLIDVPVAGRKEKLVHICLFLTGQTPLPNEGAAAIHYAWVPDNAFTAAGFLTNQSPSKVFQVPLSSDSDAVLRIGVSIEPIGNVKQHQMMNKAMSSHQIAMKVAQHFYDYVSSFPQVDTQGVPFALLKKWFENFERKINNNPQFLEKL